MNVRISLLLASTLTLGLAASPVWAETDRLTRFSTMTSLEDGWEPLTFPNIETHTRYTLDTDDGQQVIRADADASASGLIARVELVPGTWWQITGRPSAKNRPPLWAWPS